MCLIALALDRHPRFPLVIAANRDEFFERPAAALDWWQAGPDAPPILAGRDLQAGGTWLGLNARGRVAMLTNVRDLARHRASAASRGAIVPAWLAGDAAADAFWRDMAPRAHNPFNLLAGDVLQGRWWWADDRASEPLSLGPGLYGLSNAALDTPWPKVLRLKTALADAMNAARTSGDLESRLFAALADRRDVPDDALPDTGVGLARERWLAPAFIRTPDARYGTRCSTLVVAERQAAGLCVSLIERQFSEDGAAVAQRRARFVDWPAPIDGLPSVTSEPLNAG
jgi:uncharacterized protein with NRDE domain